jgi:ubiquinone/menaquinone biosynthesis C-methylase UbiE
LNPKRLHKSDYNKVLNALIDFYSKKDESYLEERAQQDYEDYADRIADIIAPSDKTILDLGSGNWKIPETLGKRGFKKVFGLDFFSEEKLAEYSKKLSVSNAELITYLNDSIPLPDKSVDAVSSLCVFEHIVHVENTLKEMYRILKPGGFIIIECPNWSGINAAIYATKHTLLKNDRYWLFENFKDAFFGIFRTLSWYFEVLFSNDPKFIMVYPRMKEGKIAFERYDDDVVHLCQPLSFKKYFKQNNYKIIKYNSGYGSTRYTFIFNRLFPSLASTNAIVAQKVV